MDDTICMAAGIATVGALYMATCQARNSAPTECSARVVDTVHPLISARAAVPLDIGPTGDATTPDDMNSLFASSEDDASEVPFQGPFLPQGKTRPTEMRATTRLDEEGTLRHSRVTGIAIPRPGVQSNTFKPRVKDCMVFYAPEEQCEQALQ
jgi:hypothetical protein